MTEVFLDTVGLLALWDVADQWHKPAEVAFAEIVAQRRGLKTTTFVLLECGNASARRPYRLEVCRLRRALDARGDLITPSDEDWRRAWVAFQRGEAGYAGIVDHVSFEVMRRLGITEAFSNDKHFRAAGFCTLF